MADSAPVGAGAAPRPSPPAADGILSIRGGIGGMSFQLEELLRGAGQLDDLVQQLLAIETETRRVQEALEPFLDGSYASGCNAINAVAGSREEIAQVRADLVGIGASVRASHRDYVEAEALSALPHPLNLPDIRFSGSPWPLGRDMTHTLATGLVPHWVGVQGLVRGLLESPMLSALRPRPVSVGIVDESVVAMDRSMAGSLRRLEELHARNEGEIEVIEFDNNGSATWMVLIPGTQPDTPSTNPLDIAGIGEAMGYDSEEVVPAIGQALREAGAEAGAQVVAVGHSQGGVHAMNLSRHQAFLSEFDLRYVVTAGAPVGGIDPEPGIGSLHLEHVQDWVPGADARFNADTRDRVTVTLTDEVRTPAGEDAGVGPGHDQENYAAGADLVNASHHQSLVASTAAFAGVVGVGGAAKVTRFKLQRDPLPQENSGPRVNTPRITNLPDTRSVAGAR